MTDVTPALAAIATAALLLGGGIAMAAPFGDQLEEDLSASANEEDTDEASAQPSDGGEMTVEESERTHEGTEATAPPFYASRVVEIQGTLTLAELPVILDTTNGDIDVQTEAGDGYGLVVNLTGYGATPDQARENREEMQLSWDAGEPGDRQLVAEVDHDRSEDGGPLSVDVDRKEADIVLTVPEDVELSLLAGSTNGAIDVANLQATGLQLDTTNGDITVEDTTSPALQVGTTNGFVDAHVDGLEDAQLESTNGDIVAELVPARTGSIQAGSTNAAVDVLVPETSAYGYEATATATNGQASIDLEDGEKESSRQGDHVEFRTDGFAGRAVQTAILVSTTNGDAHVGPLQGGSASPAGSSALVSVPR